MSCIPLSITPTVCVDEPAPEEHENQPSSGSQMTFGLVLLTFSMLWARDLFGTRRDSGPSA